MHSTRFSVLCLLFLSILAAKAGRGVRAAQWECTSDADCAGVPGASCLGGGVLECRCPAGQTLGRQLTACVPESLLGESCSEDGQCAHMLTGAHCSAGAASVCDCAEGYTYVRGRCRRLAPLHERCEEDVDCFFGYDRESVACVRNSCQCTADYYQRDENICRRKSMNAGDPCIVHQDCHGDQLVCNEFRLECEDGSQPVDPEAQAPKTTKAHSQSQATGAQPAKLPQEPASRDAATATASPPRKTVRFQETQTAIDIADAAGDDNQLAAQFGDACVDQAGNPPCPGLPHSECKHGQCRCRRGYYAQPETGACMAEIGEVAASAELCSGDGRNETTGRCVCDRNQYALSHLRECIKPGFGIGYSCTEASQCSPFGAAFCPGLEAESRRCTCHPWAVHDPVRQYCVPRKGLGARCNAATATAPATEDCATQTPDSVCSALTNQCVCRPNYLETAAGECARGVDAVCQTDDDCEQVANAECAASSGAGQPAAAEQVESRCTCRDGFVHVAGNCLRKATVFEDDCTADDQCQPLLGARGRCLDNACRCEDHHQHSNGKCNLKRALGETCASQAECHVTIEPEDTTGQAAAAVCRNGACACPFGHRKDTARQACRKNASSRMSALKAITLLLIAAACGVTTAAIHDAYF